MAYGTDAAMVAYIEATGRTLPEGAVLSALRSAGSEYTDSFEMRFRGYALDTNASFPRDVWPVVPERIEHAAYEAGWAVSQGADLFGQGGSYGGQVIREKVDVLQVDYAAPSEGMGYWELNQFILPRAYILLFPFFRRHQAYGAAFIV